MEPQPETATATVRVCGHDIQTTAEELELAGLQVKDPADFTALSQVVNLRTITLSKMTFADAEWDGSLANIKACRHLTHLNLTACSLGPKHAADLAGIFSSGGCNIDTLCLAKNGLTGASFWNDGNVRGGVDSNLDGITTLLTALKTSQVICIDFSGCGLGPGSMGHLAEYLRDAIAALARVSVLSNPIGTDGADALIEVFEQNTNLRTLLGIEEGIAEVNLSKKNVDPGQAKILASEMKAGRAAAAVEQVALAQNKLGGRKIDIVPDVALIETPVVGCFVKPPGDSECFEVISLEPVRLKDAATGEMLDEEIPLEELQSDEIALYGAKDMIITHPFADLCKGLKSSHVTSLNLSECELGSNDLTELAKYVRDARAAVEAVAIGGNPIGSEGGAILLETIKTSKLKTIDIGKPLPLQEPYELDTLDLSKTGMDSGHVLLLSWWLATDAGAALNSLRCGSNPITDKGMIPLLDAVKGIGLTELDISKTEVGPPTAAKLAEVLADGTPFSAAVKKINLSGCPLTGAVLEYGQWKNIDSDMTGFIALCGVLGKLHDINLSGCHLGPASAAEFAKAVSDAEAAVNSLTLDSNGIFGELYPSGNVKQADKFVVEVQPLLDALKTSSITSLSLRSTGMGVKGVVAVADVIRAMAAIASLKISGALTPFTS
eukprot:COSAG05_NODE_195_length_14550_cov_203.233686_2_plen_664_part_00